MKKFSPRLCSVCILATVMLLVAAAVQAATPNVKITAPSGNSEFASGEHVYFQGSATNDEGTAITGSALAWTSSRNGRIGTGESFSINELDCGTHTITLTATDGDGVSASTSIVIAIINSAPDCAITNPADGSSFAGGAEISFAGNGYDAEDGHLTGSALVWTSDKDGQIGTGTSFSRDDLSSGTHVITLTATDSEGKNNTETRQVTITVGNHSPETEILSPASNSEYAYGTTIVLSGEASDDEDGVLTGSALVWSSDRDGEIGKDKSVSVSNLSIGTHIITLTATDTDAAASADSINLIIKNTTPECSITYPASGKTYLPGADVTLVAEATDEEDGTLAEEAYSWKSSINGTLGTGSTLTVTTLSSGTHTITLTVTDSEGDTCKSSITIKIGNDKPAVAITAPQDGSEYNLGDSVIFTGSATDLDEEGEAQSLTGSSLVWTSSIDGQIGTGSSFSTANLSEGTHAITLTATDSGGATGSAEISVIVTNNKPAAEILAPSDGTSFACGAKVFFKGTGTDGEGNQLEGGSLVWTSSTDGQIGTGAAFSISTLSAGTHVITLTVTDNNGDTDTDSITITIENTAPAAKVISPMDGTQFAAGQAVSFTGTGTDKEDGTLTGMSLAWTSSIDGELGNGASTTCDSLSTGTHIITLTVTDSGGNTDSAAITIAVGNELPVVTISSPNDGAQFAEDEYVTFSGTAKDAEDGNLKGTSLAWSSNKDGELGTAQSITVPNLSAGMHTIRLTATDSQGGTDYAEISVRIGDSLPVIKILSPDDGDSFAMEDEILFKATVEDDQDGELTGSSILWSSSIDGAIGTGTSLVVDWLSAGTHIITVTATDSDGDSETAEITVRIENQLPEVTIITPADNSAYDDGATINFSGKAHDEEDGWLTGESLVWTSNRDGVLGTGTAISISSLSHGTHAITLSATDSQGDEAATAIMLNVGNAHPVAVITTPADGTVFDDDTVITFRGTGTDEEEGLLSGASLVWSSNRNGTLGTGTSFSTDKLSSGTHVITLTVTDSEGAQGTAVITITAGNNKPEVAITEPSDDDSFDQGAVVVFKGTAADAEDGDLDDMVWTSSMNGKLGTGSPFSTDALSPGTHVITLSATDEQGDTGKAGITLKIVNHAPAVQIITPADHSDYDCGATVVLNGLATDKEDGELSGSALVWTSQVDGTIGTGSVISTSSLSKGSHTITLTATDSDGTDSDSSITIYIGNAAPEVGITSPADGASYDEGDYVTLRGTATDEEDGELDTLTWYSSRDGMLGSGSYLKLNSLSCGRHTITLSATDSGDALGETAVSITVGGTPPTVEIISPANGSENHLYDEIILNGKAADAEDGELSGSALVWTSSKDGVLGTGESITVDDLSAGLHIITLTATDSQGESTSARIVIEILNTKPTATIKQPLDGSMYELGSVVYLNGAATDEEDGVLIGSSLVWSSSLDGELGTGGSLSLSTLSRGAHTITLVATDLDGTESDPATIVINIGNSPPAAAITSPTTNTFDKGDFITFRGQASDAEDGDLSGENLQWYSSLDGLIGPGKTFTVSSLSNGSHTITLVATDSQGGQDTATITITVGNTRPEVTINSPESGSTFNVADEIVFAGEATDAKDGAITGTALCWSSSLDGVLGTGTTIAAEELSSGTHIITLSATDDDGVTGYAEITISVENTEPEVEVLDPTDSGRYAKGASITFNGRGTDAEDGSLGGTSLEWHSHIDGLFGYGAAVTTSSLSRGTHVITFKATDSNGAETEASIRIHVGNAAPVPAILAPADEKGFQNGQIITFSGQACDEEDGLLAGDNLVWTSNIDGTIGTGRIFSTADLTVGVHSISLTASDSAGASAAVSITISVADASAALMVNINEPEDGQVFDEDDTITFTGTGWDEDEGWLYGDNLVWTSSLDGPIGTGTSFDTYSLTSGQHVITLTATNAFGIANSTAITITAGEIPPDIDLLEPEDGDAFYAGEAVTFRAVAYDEDDDIIAGASYEWSSNQDGVLGTGSILKVATLSQNRHTITLKVTGSDGLVARKTFTITVGTLVDAGSSRTVNEGDTVILDGGASLANTAGEGTYTWTQLSGTTVSLSGRTAAKATFTAPYVSSAGTVLIFQLTASDADGNSATDTVTIVVRDGGTSLYGEDVITFTAANDEELGIYFSSNSVAAEGSITSMDDATAEEQIGTSVPANSLYGGIEFAMNLSGGGSLATAVLYLPEPVPDGYTLYIYDEGDRIWRDFDIDDISEGLGEGFEFNGDRSELTIYIEDDGDYDNDPIAAVVQSLICIAPEEIDLSEYLDEDEASSCLIGACSSQPHGLVLLLFGLILAAGCRKHAVKRG